MGLHEFPSIEPDSREVITHPVVLMQRFLSSPRYNDALIKFKHGKNPEISHERYQRVFNELEDARCTFVDFVGEDVSFGYNSNHYPHEVQAAIRTYIDHIACVQKKNRVIRNFDDIQFDDQMRTQYHNEVATQLHLSGIAPSNELARGLARAILAATGYDNLATAKQDAVLRARIANS